MKRIFTLILVAGMVLGIFAGCGGKGKKTKDPGVLSVGYAKADITPSMDYKLPLLGNNDESTRVATGVLEPLYATCTAMSDAEGNTVILFAMDLHGIYEVLLKAVRVAIEEKLGIEGKYVQMTASHTHQAPPSSGMAEYPDSIPYFLEIVEKCAEAAKQAMEDRKPATMSLGHTRVPDLNTMRYCYLEDGTLLSGRRSEEQAQYYGQAYHPDDLLQLVKFTREGGKDVVLINWQGHYRGNPSGMYTLYSSDFMGVLRNELLNQANCESMVIMGAGGNSAHSSVYPGYNNKRNHTYETIGKTLAEAAVSTLQGGMTVADTGRVTLEENPFHIQTNPQEYCLYTFGIGDVGFCMIPYEPFQSLGMALREESPFKMTLIGTVANDYGGKFYLPDAAAYDSETSTPGIKGYGLSVRYVKGDEALFHEQYIQMLNKCFKNGTTEKKEKAEGYITDTTYEDPTEYSNAKAGAPATAVKNGLYQISVVKDGQEKVLLVASQALAEEMANMTSFKVVMDNRDIVVGLQN